MKILIVDDHEVVRMGLRTLLQGQGGLDVVGEAANGEEAIRMVKETRPDIVLLDVRLPDESGVEVCRRIREMDGRIRVLMLTSYSDEEALFSAIMAGASGYLLKQIDAEELYRSVLSVGNGKSLVDPALSEAVVARIQAISEGAPTRGMDSLTQREKEILRLIAEGLTNKEIAERIFLSSKTIRNYVSSILHKLGFSSRTQAAVYYLERKSRKTS